MSGMIVRSASLSVVLATAVLIGTVAQASAQASAQTATPTPASPANRRPAAAAPAQPATPAPAAPLPEPPIPVQHLARAGIPQCQPAVDQVSRSALAVPYNAQSTWNQETPAQHVFQSVAGVKNPRNVPSSGIVAIVAAPLAEQKCDVVAVEVYPLAGSCADVQKLMQKGGEVETGLLDIKVITDLQKRRLFLMPGFGNSCIAVSVNSFFSP